MVQPWPQIKLRVTKVLTIAVLVASSESGRSTSLAEASDQRNLARAAFQYRGWWSLHQVYKSRPLRWPGVIDEFSFKRQHESDFKAIFATCKPCKRLC